MKPANGLLAWTSLIPRFGLVAVGFTHPRIQFVFGPTFAKLAHQTLRVPTVGEPKNNSMTYLILAVFILGYLAIALEHKLHINKAATALLIGTVCWTLYLVDLPDLLPADAIPAWFSQFDGEATDADLPLHYAIDVQHLHQTGEIASILFFLIGAMTIVELTDAHYGFALVTD